MKWRHAATPPSDGTWCWVSDGNKTIWIMKADKASVGGWTNEDCGEDFERRIRWFWIIELPIEAPPS